MTSDAARQVLVSALDAKSPALANFVIRGDALSGAEVRRFSIEEDMAAVVLTDIIKAVTALTGKHFLNYDPSYQTNSSQVLVEELAEVPELAAVDAALRSGDVSFDTGGTHAVAMAHTVGIGEQRIVAYRLKGPGIATRRARGITLIPRDGVYRPVTGDVLFYEPRFDAYTCGGFVFFANVSLIQTKLHADDKARELAKQTLAEVTAQVLIDGFTELEKAVMDDPTLRAKMAAVARLIQADAEYAKKLTTANLVAFVAKYPEYGIQVSKLDGQQVLRFDPSPQHRHQIPRLLADDYLHSYLTDRNYEAGSKQQVKA